MVSRAIASVGLAALFLAGSAHWKIDAANAPVSAPDRFSSRHAIDALNRNGR
jgi:hypothetical protein